MGTIGRKWDKRMAEHQTTRMKKTSKYWMSQVGDHLPEEIVGISWSACDEGALVVTRGSPTSASESSSLDESDMVKVCRNKVNVNKHRACRDMGVNGVMMATK